MTPEQFDVARKMVDTPSGRIAYIENGEGPVALFIHGFPLNSYHWRYQLEALADVRRCIAPDLLGLGHSEVSSDTGLDFDAQAQMLTEFLDALGIVEFDLVGNDSGGAIAQILATNMPDRIRTLTLTNCDTIGNWPPPAFRPLLQLAHSGRLGQTFAALAANQALAQSAGGLGSAFEFPEQLTTERLDVYLGPVTATSIRQGQIDRYAAAIDTGAPAKLLERLKAFEKPTLIVWGTGDPFFAAEGTEKWAIELHDAVSGARDLIVLAGAKLFFPEERPEELIVPLRQFWTQA